MCIHSSSLYIILAFTDICHVQKLKSRNMYIAILFINNKLVMNGERDDYIN